jgi:transketolase
MPTKAKSTRDGFGEGLLELISKNKKILALTADLTSSLKLNEIEKKYPENLIQVGVAEQNMIGVAMGLAKAEKVPFATSFAVFNPGLNWSQIRLACYSNSNIKIIGGHAGLATGADGATHQALEDIALMRVLPNMTVLAPADYQEAKKATAAIAKHEGPAYLRLFRPACPTITHKETPFKIGQSLTLKKGKDITIIACGFLVQKALKIAESLKKFKISLRVINMHTIKPIDKNAIEKAAIETKAIITLEDHQIAGGLGSAVLEVLAEKEIQTKVINIGVKDQFGESGTSEELLKKHGLDKDSIVKVIRKLDN